jgi:hypothetical protein
MLSGLGVLKLADEEILFDLGMPTDEDVLKVYAI